MVHLRPFRQEDISEIDTIWRRFYKGQFGVPSLKNVIESKVITADGKILGFGMVKLFAEGVIILDKDAPLNSRAKGIIVGIEHAMDVVKQADLEQFHIFTDDPHYIEVLQKHWGFRTTPEKVLYREIG
jgi:hypothetical protein